MLLAKLLPCQVGITSIGHTIDPQKRFHAV
jgi:hypothetical protein